MADHFTEFSEVIPHLTPDEEAWLRDQLQVIQVFDGQEYPAGNLPAHLAARDPDWQGCRFLRDIEDADECTDGWAGFSHELADDGDRTPGGWGRHLWLHSDEGVSLDRVVHLVQKFLARFRPEDCWSATYAEVCSRPRVGEFGGGGIVVTASGFQWFRAHTWVDDTKAARQAPRSRKEVTND
jgi:hypothetical protein